MRNRFAGAILINQQTRQIDIRSRIFQRRLRLPGHRLLVGRDRLLAAAEDRKSTRLNSSHLVISYAVFCLKKNVKNVWSAPFPPANDLFRQITTSTTSIYSMSLQAASANLRTDQERDYFMQR